jgi:hypothetical protein
VKASVALPFLRPQDHRVADLDWGIRPQAEDDLIKDWDPNTNIGASVKARVDRRGVLSDTGLAPDAPLALSLTWSSLATNSSGVLRSTALDLGAEDECLLWGEISGQQLARSVDLALTLHLAASVRHQKGSLSPWLVGSVLWQRSRRYFIEGDAARFPVETRDFSSAYGFPSGAAWYLDWSPNVPTDSFLGSVRLYLNSSHPLVQKLAYGQTSDEPEIDVLKSLLRTDVARQLVCGALSSDAFLEGDSFEPGMVGHHVRMMLSNLFPDRTIEQIALEMRERPNNFEAQLQSRLRFLRS